MEAVKAMEVMEVMEAVRAMKATKAMNASTEKTDWQPAGREPGRPDRTRPDQTSAPRSHSAYLSTLPQNQPRGTSPCRPAAHLVPTRTHFASMSGKYVGVPGDEYELPETKTQPPAQATTLAHSASVQSVEDEGQASRLRHSPDVSSGSDARDVELSMPVFMDEPRKPAPVPLVLRIFQTRLARLGVAVVVIVLLIILVTGAPSSSAARLRAKLKGAAQGWGYTIAPDARIHAATAPKYDDPFNPDDLTFTEEECDAYFPALWKDIDRSVRYFTEHPYVILLPFLLCAPGWAVVGLTRYKA